MNTDTARRFKMLAEAAMAALVVLSGCGGKDAPKTPTVDAQAETAPDTAAILVDSRDGKRYKIVTIGTQTWFARNLDYEAVGSVCYDNKPENCGRYGRLYTWDAAMKACPAGTHLPSDEEWTTLTNYVGGERTAGTRLKAKTGWKRFKKVPAGEDKYGFSALPGSDGYGGAFYGVGENGYWWSATENDVGNVWRRCMDYDYERVNRNKYLKTGGQSSVRCVLDDKEGLLSGYGGKEMSKTLAVDVSAETAAPDTAVTVDIKIDMVFVEGGTFTMGCTPEQGNDCKDDEKPAHRVTLSDFYISKYEVTFGQWKAVIGSYPLDIMSNDVIDNKLRNLPVEAVNFDEVLMFIQKLNTMSGKKYRLPTEAEWEYAARGGNKSKGYKYAGSNNMDEVAWYEGNSGNKTRYVGSKAPNELGIYDMSGNVLEWVSDWYGDYGSSTQTNPTGTVSGSWRVVRGGGWPLRTNSRVSYRSYQDPTYREVNIGFRLAHDANKEGQK